MARPGNEGACSILKKKQKNDKQKSNTGKNKILEQVKNLYFISYSPFVTYLQ